VKRYVLTRFPSGCVVRVFDGERDAGLLRHLVYHSPDGFEWGYGGSGPSDLARSIVGDLICDPNPPPALYRPVVTYLVARVPDEGGELTEADVRRVVSLP